MNRAKIESIAKKVVSTKCADINAEVARASQEENLPVDAIKALTQVVNTLLSLGHLDSSADRAADFNLADPSKILKIVMRVETGDTNGPSCDETKLSSDYAYMPEKDEPKLATSVVVELPQLPEYKTRSKRYEDAVKIAAVAANFRKQRAECEHEYVAIRNKVAENCRQLTSGVSFDKIADVALCLHGVDAVEPLSSIAEILGKDASELSTKLAALRASNYKRIVRPDSYSGKIARMIELNKTYESLTESLKKF